MLQSLDNILLHIVFSVKHRAPLLLGEERPALYSFFDRAITNLGCVCLKVGGVDDHVHLAVRLSRTTTAAQLVERAKTATSRMLKTRGGPLAGFAWQRGYGVFSVGQTHFDALAAYIDGQEEHHRNVNFQDEFRHLLWKNGIEGDKEHMWD